MHLLILMKRSISFSFLIPFTPSFSICLGLLLTCGVFTVQAANRPKYRNPALSVEQRTNDLLRRMTLEEKVGQLLCFLGWDMYQTDRQSVGVSDKFRDMIERYHAGMLWATFRADPWTRKTLENGLTPSKAAEAANALQRFAIEHSRLGIPVFLAEEAAHGHMAIGTTVFPTSLGQAATFNTELIKEMGQVIGKELRAQGAHIAYGPILDLSRDPRWSRVEETYGEDPELVSAMGEALVRGLGGGDLTSPHGVISTLKHFVAYGSPEGGQNGNPSVVGTRDLHENFLYPFKTAIDAGALSVMTSYNSIDGIPSTMNKHLLTDVLRRAWHFKGYVVSDLYSIEGIRSSHYIAESDQDAAIKAIEAGTNVDLGGEAFAHLVDAVRCKKLDEKVVDRAVRYVLELKFRMGLFDSPYVDPETARNDVAQPAHLDLARRIAQQSVVLLENNHQILPLRRAHLRVAVVGPNADNQYNQLGDYTAPQPEAAITTVLEGIAQKVGSDHVIYAKGCAIRDTANSAIPEAVKAVLQADVAVVVVGGSSARDFKTTYKETGAAEVATTSVSDMECGEGYDRASLDLLGRQMELLAAIKRTGKPMIVVYLQGRPLNMNWASEHADALLTAWYPGQEGGTAIADVLFGDYNPSGRLPISVPRQVGQIPCYYNRKHPKSHNYVEIASDPLYSFGYGKSYTTFAYDDLQIDSIGECRYAVRFKLTNTGAYDGTEIPQLYLRDEYASTVRPQKQLKAFRPIFLRRGESRSVVMTLSKEAFSLIDPDLKRVVEPGDFKIMIGPSSAQVALEKTLRIHRGYVCTDEPVTRSFKLKK